MVVDGARFFKRVGEFSGDLRGCRPELWRQRGGLATEEPQRSFNVLPGFLWPHPGAGYVAGVVGHGAFGLDSSGVVRLEGDHPGSIFQRLVASQDLDDSVGVACLVEGCRDDVAVEAGGKYVDQPGKKEGLLVVEVLEEEGAVAVVHSTRVGLVDNIGELGVSAGQHAGHYIVPAREGRHRFEAFAFSCEGSQLQDLA